MNILYLTNHLNIGGITSYILTLADGMKERGHNVYVASGKGELISKITQAGITYISLPINTKAEISPNVLISLMKLLPEIKKKNIDIIHVNTRVTQVLGCLLSHYSGKPFITTCHGFFKKRFFRKIFPCWGTKVIAISKQVKEHLLQDFGIKKEDIRVIHNGIEINKFKIQNSKSKIEIKKGLDLEEDLVVGVVARLSDVKGHAYLIKAMKIVLNELPQTKLLIVGEGRIKQDLVNLTKNLGLEKNILFVPCVLDTSSLLSIMDLFVMPSLKEGLGLALMEAMAAGLAVIGSDIGGIRDLIQDGYTGLLVRPADIDALAKTILALLNNSEKREYLADNARTFIAKNFSKEQMLFETEDVYLECLNIKG